MSTQLIGITEAARRAKVNRKRLNRLARDGRIVGAQQLPAGQWILPWPMEITGTRLSKLAPYAVGGGST